MTVKIEGFKKTEWNVVRYKKRILPRESYVR